MLIGDLMIRMAADFADLRTGLSQVSKQTGEMQGSMDNLASKGIGAVKGAIGGLIAGLTVGAFVHQIKSAIDYADMLDELSAKTGVQVETLAGFQLAANQSGVSIEEVGKGIGKLNIKMAEAEAGNKKAQDAFKQLGVDYMDTATGKLRPTEDVLLDIADQFSKHEDGAGKAAGGSEVFGKSVQALIPFLNMGKEGLEETIAKVKRYGGVSTETASQAGKFNDTVAEIQMMMGALWREIAAALLPVLQTLADWFVNLKTDGTGFKDIANGIVVAIKAMIVIIAGAVAIIRTLGIRIGEFAAHVATAFDMFADIYNTVKTAMDKVIGIWDAAATKIGTVWKDLFKDNEKKMEDWIGDQPAVFQSYLKLWTDLGTDVLRIWGHFITGDWAKLLKDFETLWDNFTKNLEQYWKDLKIAIGEIWDAVILYVSDALEPLLTFIDETLEQIETYWDELTEGIEEIWDAICLYVEEALAPFITFVDETLADIEQLWEDLTGGIEEIWDAICLYVEEALEPVFTFIDETLTDISDLWDDLKTAVEDIWDALMLYVGEAIGAVVEFIDPIIRGITEIWQDIVTAITTLWQGMVDNLMVVLSPIIESIKTVVGGISSVFEAVGTTVGTVWSAAMGTVETASAAAGTVVGDNIANANLRAYNITTEANADVAANYQATATFIGNVMGAGQTVVSTAATTAGQKTRGQMKLTNEAAGKQGEEMEKLRDKYLKFADPEFEYKKAMDELATLQSKGGKWSLSTEEYAAAVKGIEEKYTDAGKKAKEHEDAVQKMVDKMTEVKDGGMKDYTVAVEALNKMVAAGKLTDEEYETQLQDSWLTYTDTGKEVAKLREEHDKTIKKMDETIEKLKEQNDTFGMSKVAVEEWRLKQQLEAGTASVEWVERQNEIIAQLKRNEGYEAAAKNAEEYTKAIEEETKKQEKAWGDVYKTIEGFAEDAFMGMFEKGTDVWGNMWAKLKDVAKNALWEVAKSQVVAPMIGALGSALGIPGLAQAAGMAGGGGSGIFGLLGGLFGGGGGMYTPGSADFVGPMQPGAAGGGGFMGMLGSAGSMLGGLFGGGGAAAAGAGAGWVASSTGLLIPAAEAGIAAAGATTGLLGAAGGMMAAMAPLMAAAPYIALAAVAVMAIMSALDEGDAERTARFATGSRLGPGNPLFQRREGVFGAFGLEGEKWFSDKEMGPQIGKMLDNIALVDKALSKAIGEAATSVVKAGLATEKEYGFELEHTDLDAAGVTGKIMVDRYRAIFDILDRRLTTMLDGFSGTGEELATTVVALGTFYATMKKMPPLISDTMYGLVATFDGMASDSGKFVSALTAFAEALSKEAADVQANVAWLVGNLQVSSDLLLEMLPSIAKFGAYVGEMSTVLQTKFYNAALAHPEAIEALSQFAQSYVSITLMLALDINKVAADTLAESTETVYEKMLEARDAASALLATYDYTVESTQELEAATSTYWQAQAQAVMQILQMKDALKEMFSGSIRNIQLQMMSDQERQQFFLDEANNAMAALRSGTIVDPTKISELGKLINDDLVAAFGLVDPEQQAAVYEDYIASLQLADTVVQEALENARRSITEQNTTQKSVMDQIKDAINVAALKIADGAADLKASAGTTKDAATLNMEAAGLQVNAAGTMINAAARIENAPPVQVNVAVTQGAPPEVVVAE